jgi:hypothetical protein
LQRHKQAYLEQSTLLSELDLLLEDTLLGDEPARASKEVREAPNTHTHTHTHMHALDKSRPTSSSPLY